MQVHTLISTIHFAALKHREQRRKNLAKDPYINHPISVANYISNIGKVDDIEVLQAALLHDVLEDTMTTEGEIESKFGTSVLNIVRDVTDDTSLPKLERKLAQISHGPEICTKAKIVKLADKLDNLKGLFNDPPKGWTKDIVFGYFEWSYRVIEGLRGANALLEAELDVLFNSTITIDGESYPVLALSEKDRETTWTTYVELLKNKK